jgi:PAS domain S-box-containing protein
MLDVRTRAQSNEMSDLGHVNDATSRRSLYVPSPPCRRDIWMSYIVAILGQVAFLAVLESLMPHFPIGEFPIVNVLPMMAVAYFLGAGPIAVAFVVNLAAFVYLFVHPQWSFRVSGFHAWANIVTYFVALSIVVCSMTVIRHGKRRLQERNQRLALLSNTAAQLLVSDQPQALAQSLCERVMTHLNCHVFFNFLANEERGCLRLNACAGIPEDVAKNIEWLEYGAAVCGCAARDGCRIVAEDIFNTPDPRTDLVKSFGIQAYACHPLLGRGGRVLGTLSFGSKTKRHFSDDDLALMKTVADQVATAMERARLLEAERLQGEALRSSMERLRLAQDAADCGVWEWDLQTNENIWSDELWRLYGVARNSCKPTYEAWRGIVHPDDREQAEKAVQEAARNGSELNLEFRVRHNDGSERWLMSKGRPFSDVSGGQRYIGIVMDITGRKQAEQAQKELEDHKREFYQHTILAATNGKLMITERVEIEAMAGPVRSSWKFNGSQDLCRVRDEAVEAATSLGLEHSQLNGFASCVGEATSNACKHAGGGTASLHESDGQLFFVVADNGPGIDTANLPDVALVRGYTTTGTLGMGYKLMMASAERVYLATGSDGTVVAVEMRLHKNSSAATDLSL